MAEGWAEVLFGGDSGRMVTLRAGDAVLISAGVDHRQVSASDDFIVVQGLSTWQSTETLHDEPANLDVHLRATMEEEFLRFHRHSGATLLYITHDQREAMALADRIVVLDHGKLMQFASPQTLWREPANEMAATFIDEGLVLPVSDVEPLASG